MSDLDVAVRKFRILADETCKQIDYERRLGVPVFVSEPVSTIPIPSPYSISPRIKLDKDEFARFVHKFKFNIPAVFRVPVVARNDGRLIFIIYVAYVFGLLVYTELTVKEVKEK